MSRVAVGAVGLALSPAGGVGLRGVEDVVGLAAGHCGLLCMDGPTQLDALEMNAGCSAFHPIRLNRIRYNFGMAPEAPQLSDFLCFAIYSANLAYGKAYKPILDSKGITYTQYIAIVALQNRTVRPWAGWAKSCSWSPTR